MCVGGVAEEAVEECRGRKESGKDSTGYNRDTGELGGEREKGTRNEDDLIGRGMAMEYGVRD